ncbi:MAG: SMP-30/gluconolactonase/LRE family protein [Gemmatimonadota bacterium]|nr:SMP-30/gluconolactonase/LRE family protein [Gemmatimonadota bacterium]MDH4350212.1 SMP-30/gluconolactonase/LRE family protein [Gemmatimonadota bacterium]MDH5196514.1 SMP-30/gluconolactonase/LRE family protein [Gemmatimonadota bacterium]
MRTIAVFTATMLAAAACQPADRTTDDTAATPAATAMDIAEVGFATPESMLHDPVADVYLVSNINGELAAKDDNGFIARLSPTGEILTLKWIDGAADGVTLHAPKGMALAHDTLFVADIDAVRLFDRVSGAPLGEWPLDGAAFLNDLAVGPDGTLYVTDTGVEPGEGGLVPNGKDGVYRREAGRWAAVVTGQGLGNPNGILAEAAGLTVVTFVSGEVYTVDPATGERTMLPKPEAGGLDGVARLADGSLLIGSWGARGIYRLSPDGSYSRMADTVESPADIGLDATRGAVLIPDFVRDRVLIRPVR